MGSQRPVPVGRLLRTNSDRWTYQLQPFDVTTHSHFASAASPARAMMLGRCPLRNGLCRYRPLGREEVSELRRDPRPT